MNNFFRALIAGYGAKKLGGGCLGTVVVFIIIWVALGQCSWRTIKDSVREEAAMMESKVNERSLSLVTSPDTFVEGCQN